MQDNANAGWQFAKANFKIKIKFFENLLQKRPAKTRQPQSTCGLQCFSKNNIVKLLVPVSILLKANGSAIIKSVL